ncbi:MAG TPA: DUF4129 domain-containing protein [Candidatus Acidoferrum sp.]|nr:DUF4129 domain-containing protein [Candidatus Acidoferrum sp.]
MQRRLLLLPFVLWILACLVLLAQAQPTAAASQDPAASQSYDPRTFALELRGLSAALKRNPSPAELASIRDTLPKVWNVTTAERSYSIPTDLLHEKLAAASLAGAREWLDHLALEIESYSDLRIVNSQNARSELTHVLAQPEFAGVRPPSAWDLFRQRLAALFERLLYKILRGVTRYPIGGKILFWLFVFGGVLLVAVWVFRFLVSRDRMDVLPVDELLVPARTWQEWVRLSREAANRQDYREAIHAAYWAGIVRLQDTGVLPRDRAKTPREYLHIVSEPAEHELTSQSALREPLASLTARLERTWYANRGAGPDDFRESLRQLEALGCPLE